MFKKYLPTTLFGRTFLIVMVPVLILQIAVSVVFFQRHWSKMTERLAYAVSGEMLAALDKVHEKPDLIPQFKNLLRNRLGLGFEFYEGAASFPEVAPEPYDPSDIRFASHWNFEDAIRDDLSDQISRMTKTPFDVIVRPTEKTVIVYFLMTEGLAVFTIPEGRLYSSSSYIFILWMMGLSLLLFTISMIFMRNQIRPIYRLGILAERLGRGIPVGKIKPTGAKEVRQAAEAFVNMQERINQYIDQRTTMLAGVSHDLRTPLTRMKLQLEMMADTADADAMRGDIHDMEQMIEGYLSFAKGDGGEDMQRINLKSILDKIIDDAGRMGLDIMDNRQRADDVMIWAKPQSLLRALDNFISNAAHYATLIQFDLDVQDQSISIIMRDNGSGIPEDELNEVLKPFVRGEKSRNLKTGGVGLGLTIANDIIISHGGSLNLSKSAALGGLKITVTLPI